MLGPVLLSIRLNPDRLPPMPGDAWLNQIQGGPDALLRWLETQLGLLAEPVALSSRITEYAAALEQVADACYCESLKVDRWATATELLSRRDELRLGGWNEHESRKVPPLLRDMARAVTATTIRFPDPATRIQGVLAALDAGQALPAHQVFLFDPVESWPPRWRDLLRRLTAEQAAPPLPGAPQKTSLRTIQEQLVGGGDAAVIPDSSLRWVRCRSIHAACEAIAEALAQVDGDLGNVVVHCEDPNAAVCLDSCLNRRGLPTMGAALRSLSHPVLQVLPLVLNLIWDPVDPSLLMDFLNLPVGPIPKAAARRLASALAEQPGLGSREWDKAVEELCTDEDDRDRRLRERLDAWLAGPRFSRGSALPTAAVSDKCRQVAQWAAGYAAMLEEKAEATDAALVLAFKYAAGQASTLGQLTDTHGGEITEPQLLRMRDAAVTEGTEAMPYMTAAAGPRWVSSLAEIAAPCPILIWLGLGTGDAPRTRWTAHELRRLAEIGVNLDDGSRMLASIRGAEMRGLCHVTQSLLAVSLPSDEEKRPHPLCLRIHSALERQYRENPISLEDMLTDGASVDVSPWKFKTANAAVQARQPRRPIWHVSPALLEDRQRSSASELEDRLGCPLKWVFHYPAKLRPSPIARLPNDFLLKGSFCHSVLEEVFGHGEIPLEADTVVQRVISVFDERLPLDAAPLGRPARALERQRLRDELAAAARVFVEALRRGGYKVAAIELEWEGSIDERELAGRIDCLAVRPDGREAVIDFKYAGRNKYRDLLENGRALQLATYAYGRSQIAQAGQKFPAVAYLVLVDGLLYTPSGSALEGQQGGAVINGPAISQVWDAFVEAIKNAEVWLRVDGKIPARPLQPADQWPAGASLALDGPDGKGRMPEEQRVCEYCDYRTLCGLRELE